MSVAGDLPQQPSCVPHIEALASSAAAAHDAAAGDPLIANDRNNSATIPVAVRHDAADSSTHADSLGESVSLEYRTSSGGYRNRFPSSPATLMAACVLVILYPFKLSGTWAPLTLLLRMYMCHSIISIMMCSRSDAGGLCFHGNTQLLVLGSTLSMLAAHMVDSISFLDIGCYNCSC